MDIDEKIKELNKEDFGKLDERVINNLYSRMWCATHGIDYCDPDVQLTKEKTYQEMFGEKNE